MCDPKKSRKLSLNGYKRAQGVFDVCQPEATYHRGGGDRQEKERAEQKRKHASSR